MGLLGPSNDKQVLDWIDGNITDRRHAAEAKRNFLEARSNKHSVKDALSFVKRDLRKLGYRA